MSHDVDAQRKPLEKPTLTEAAAVFSAAAAYGEVLELPTDSRELPRLLEALRLSLERVAAVTS